MKRILLTLVWILTATVVCSAQTTFYFPHVADGLLLNTFRWKTTIFLTNPASSGTASGTVTFTRENSDPGLAGSNFSTISFVDEAGAPAGNGGIITFSIPAGATRKYTSTGAGAYAGGFATVASNVPVNGTAVFSEFNLAGQLIAEAGVPSVGAFPRQSIFVDTVGGYNVGVAYANPGTAAANVTLTLLNSAPALQATTTRLLGPGNHAALFTVELFQNANPPIPPLVGTVQITSASPLAMIALRFDPSFNVFTTLPPVTLTALLNPAVEWLQQRPWLTPLTSVAKLLGSFQLRIG